MYVNQMTQADLLEQLAIRERQLEQLQQAYVQLQGGGNNVAQQERLFKNINNIPGNGRSINQLLPQQCRILAADDRGTTIEARGNTDNILQDDPRTGKGRRNIYSGAGQLVFNKSYTKATIPPRYGATPNLQTDLRMKSKFKNTDDDNANDDNTIDDDNNHNIGNINDSTNT
ncbi:hypothetical protein ACLKA6_016007 [Drosophila palustris]